MNYAMVNRLILKDWYLNRWLILASIPAGLLALGIILTGSNAAFLLGLILLIMIIVSVGAQLAIATTVIERKEQTLAFVMSLPISYREYTAAKIIGNLIIFLVPWLALVAGSFALIFFAPGVPHGFVPFVAVMAVEILVSNCFITAMAITTESQNWCIGAIMVGNLFLNAFGYYVAHIPSIASSLWRSTLHWPPAASALLCAEFLAIALLVALMFYIQSRKKDFL